jgi:ubiquitin-conjugating enzyme E2 J2
VLEGDADSPYSGGWYHGKIVFPNAYPYKPPSITMLTPSGRFEPAMRICLSISDFHPETWNPLWGVRLILLGLQSFFYEDASTTGALHGVPVAQKRRMAASSLPFNVRNPTFRKLFPELVKLHEERMARGEGAAAPNGDANGGGSGGDGEAQGRLHDGIADLRGLRAPPEPLGWKQLLLSAVAAALTAVVVLTFSRDGSA